MEREGQKAMGIFIETEELLAYQQGRTHHLELLVQRRAFPLRHEQLHTVPSWGLVDVDCNCTMGRNNSHNFAMLHSFANIVRSTDCSLGPDPVAVLHEEDS